MRLVCGAVIRLYVAIRLFFAHRGKCSEIAKRSPLKCIYSPKCKRLRLYSEMPSVAPADALAVNQGVQVVTGDLKTCYHLTVSNVDG